MDRGAETNKQIDFTVNLKDVYILKNLLTDLLTFERPPLMAPLNWIASW